jgi:hypothetical protein
MISARIEEDFFFMGSLPARRALGLCPQGIAPVLVDDCGWLAVSIVKLSKVRLFGLPVVSEAICAGLLLVVDYADLLGTRRRGNLFLRGYTTSRLLAQSDAMLALGIFRLSALRLEQKGSSVVVAIPGEFDARIDLSPPITTSASHARVFTGNRSAVVNLRRLLCHVQLRKAHWDLQPRRVDIVDASIFRALGARIECCLDTSQSRGRWALPRPIGRSLQVPA